MALGRVNLSRAPHCPAAFSLGNEVMETRLDLPFPAPHDVHNFTPSFYLWSLCPSSTFRWLASTSFPSSVLSIRLSPTAPRFVAIVLGSPFRRRFAFTACCVSSGEQLTGIRISKPLYVYLPGFFAICTTATINFEWRA